MTDNKTADTPAGLAVTHKSNTEFVDTGLRTFFKYRDLGIRAATDGQFGAHVIRAKSGSSASPNWHTHTLDFQMVYVTRGWVEFEYEGVGKVRLVAGSCAHQPPGCKHRELAHSDDLELLEITMPADFATQSAEP